MYSKWTQHLKDDPDKQDRFRNEIISSANVLDRLKEILIEEDNTIDRSELAISSYDSPSWAHKQAYKNGYRAALAVVSQVVTLDQADRDKK